MYDYEKNLQMQIAYDLKKNDMTRHIVQFNNNALLAYLEAGMNVKRTYKGDTPMQKPLPMVILRLY